MAIYNADIATERRMFINWICRHFHHKKYNKSEHIMLNEILDVYKYMYPRTQWEIADMMDVLYDIGYLWEDMKSLNLSIKVESLTDLSKDCLIQFMHIAKQDVKPAIRKLMGIAQFQKEVADAGVAQQVAMTMDDHLFVFYNMWCIDTRRPEWAHIPPAFKKAIKGDVFRAYKAFCIRNGFTSIENKVLRLFLKRKGHTESSGYACGRSGQSFFHWLYVPGSGGFKADGGFYPEEELSMATRYNQLLIRVGRNYYNNTGAELVDISDEHLTSIAAERIEQIKLNVPGVCSQIKEIEDSVALSNVSEAEQEVSTGIYYDAEEFDIAEEDTEDQLEGPIGLGEFTDTDNARIEESFNSEELCEQIKEKMKKVDSEVEEVDVDPETIAMLEKLGFSSDKVAEISGKSIKTK